MWARSLVAVVAIVVGTGIAYAGPKQDIQAKVKEAYENYDLMDYDAARKSLNQALAIAKKAKLDKDPGVARAYLAMGIVALVDKDTDAAKLAFLSAVQIDPKIQLDAGYKSPEANKLLDQARVEAAGGGDTGEPDVAIVEPAAGGADCATVKGLDHKIIDSGTAGVALPIEALVATDVVATKIAVMYRPEGATDFTEVKLKKDGECKYTGSIPASGMKGGVVHYYVAAFNEVGKPIASKGSSGSPNIVELAVATGGGGGVGAGDVENPIGSTDTGISQSVTVGPKPAKVMLAFAGGTGFGYVSGETEAMNSVKNCCIGNSLVVLQPEIGFYVSPQMSIGVAARIGIPVGANVEGHATAAPGGLVRVRYSTGAAGTGLRFLGQAGIGVMRNTIKLDNVMPGEGDTDVVAQGPLLIGAGIGFARPLSSSVAFTADLSALAGIPMGSVLAGLSPQFNAGVGADLSIGLQFGL